MIGLLTSQGFRSPTWVDELVVFTIHSSKHIFYHVIGKRESKQKKSGASNKDLRRSFKFEHAYAYQLKVVDSER
jgi:hypothetical protein